MKILADENIEAAMVGWLRREGHDVAWAAELHASDTDVALLQIARESSQILLTRDRDFGELVYRDGRAANGIILVRIQAANQRERLELFQRLWPLIEQHAPGHFIVATKHQVRVRDLPTSSE
jgi:predicted nuclease of predicted toxin-antitoxin system